MNRRDGAVAHPALQAGIELGRVEIGGEDSGQLRVIAVVDELKELFLRPWSSALYAEVVENEDGRRADELEQFVVAHIAAGLIGRAKVIEEVWDDHEERRDAGLKAAASDSGGEVRLAAAAGAGEDEPAFGLFCEPPGCLDAAREVLLESLDWAAAERAEAGERPPG